jgi:hypothetical protein
MLIHEMKCEESNHGGHCNSHDGECERQGFKRILKCLLGGSPDSPGLVAGLFDFRLVGLGEVLQRQDVQGTRLDGVRFL